ncbi:MAG TPA: hypothetical protein PLP29_18520 [Candidatus Ozemobacteraceae bacterium]|nr:hypothetical protein [Candidatus Ozemobacteraceae bacterium]
MTRAVEDGRRSLAGWAFTLIALCLALFVIAPADRVDHEDAKTYLYMATSLYEQGNFGGTFIRMPLYPALLGLLMVFDEHLVTLHALQALLLAASGILVFRSCAARGRPLILCALAGSAFLWPTVAFAARMVMTEAVSIFLLTLLFLSWRDWLEAGRKRDAAVLFTAQLLAVLTKPVFAMLPWLFAAFWLAKSGVGKRSLARACVVFLVPFLLGYGGTALQRYAAIGQFAYCPTAGFNLTNKVGGFWEHARPDARGLVSAFLPVRDAQVARLGSHEQAVWAAIPGLRKRFGLSYTELNAAFLEIGFSLIRDRPLGYAENVLASIRRGLTIEPHYSWVKEGPVSSVFYVIHRILFVLFWIVIIRDLFSAARRPRLDEPCLAVKTTVVAIYAANVLLEFGDDFRLLMLLLPFMYLLALDGPTRLFEAKSGDAQEMSAG